ncbi:receptor-like protein kinase 5 [Carya illinoinensis]|uniref:Protein kinase domain-containing protein n=2 Tax=Carya illinoinensis TaxID=32201 RepID=A0A8T1R7Q6_CARIL|nr:receptor-like protein kinase 5 [Carya illinoinensis]KAG6662161.1 hypothetical protein CIPAW_03G224100 [Carya illinoinensis]
MSRTIPTFVDFSLYTNFFMIFLLLLLSHANSQLSTQEQAVLLNLKQHWQNPNSLSLWIPWNSSSHCNWLGISCFNDSVTELYLQSKNIYGTIPSFICNLKNLKAINLSDNYFSSIEFPRALYNCSKLEGLDLSQNYFAGAIPDDIHCMAQLHNLNLGGNNFSGNIPSSIGQLAELRTLELYACQFIGSLPPEIGNLSNLEELGLAWNSKMMPRLPSNFTKLKKLKVLWMVHMNLVGEIPDKIGEMTSLEKLDLSKNYLTGKIPSSLFMPKNLRIVYLYKNNLSGEIPQVVEALNLNIIDLSENNLTGTVPNDFGKLKKLSSLSLFCNQLFGKIPDSIGRLPGLIVLKLFSNNFSGALPPDFGRYSMLQEFQVATNMLTGQLPEHLCDNGRLLGVVAFKNNLDGELPKSLGNCSSLLIVSVFSNRLSGSIPSGLWTSQNMGTLMLSDNSFIGELPEILSRNLSRLEISNNMFSGKIPKGPSSWRNLVVLKASNNLLNGTIPQELTILPNLITLLLDRNQLSGSLPSDIISWKALNFLNVSRNAICGQIPGKLGSLPSLLELDLSENQLSSQIPPQLGFLKLTSLNLSSNHLSGSIPIEFENDAYAKSFLNNPHLCANRPSLNINNCNSKLQNPSKTSHQLMAWIISLVMAVVLGLLISLFIIRAYGKRKHGSDSTWNVIQFQNLNFTESDILSGLTEKNVIGCGGSGKVYCVSFNNSLDRVAVKKIWNNKKLEEKLEKEFLAEVKILSSIRHSNIVKLLCCISSDNTKLLVYKYLKNGSLDQWLHGKSKASTVSGSVHHIYLDWPKRLHIAVGAAQGLAYMHHDCSPPIVHRDVKSSNILLDLEFNAQIADFGLAKMLMKEGESTTMSSVAGSFGYIAPEYARTKRVNEKIDVYSFGVILLELTTGRKANEGDEHTSLAEWAWRYVQEDKFIADALEEEVKEHCCMDSMCRVFKLGINCTHIQPFMRPSMKEVLKVLLRCYNHLLLSYGEKINDASTHACNIDAYHHLKSLKHERMLEHDDDDGISLASII